MSDVRLVKWGTNFASSQHGKAIYDEFASESPTVVKFYIDFAKGWLNKGMNFKISQTISSNVSFKHLSNDMGSEEKTFASNSSKNFTWIYI